MGDSRRVADRTNPLRQLPSASAGRAFQVLQQALLDSVRRQAESVEGGVGRSGRDIGNPIDLTARCEHCQKPLEPGRKDRMYCSPRCKSQAAWSLEREARDEDLAKRQCAQCGGPLPHGKRADVVYCSRACLKQAAYARWIAAGNRTRPHSERRMTVLKACTQCGDLFHPFDRTQRFCSQKCNADARWKRRPRLTAARFDAMVDGWEVYR